jgi:hypothetical protein
MCARGLANTVQTYFERKKKNSKKKKKRNKETVPSEEKGKLVSIELNLSVLLKPLH